MDDIIFDQLDQLVRGAQGSGSLDRQAPLSQYVQPSPAAYHEYDTSQAYPPQQYGYHADDGYDEEPLRLDKFDQQLLQEPDYNSRHGQAALGNARLSLSSARGLPPQYFQPSNASAAYPLLPPTQRPHLSQFAHNPDHPGRSSSPMHVQNLPSSPSFGASQRRTGDYGSVPETPRATSYQRTQPPPAAPASPHYRQPPPQAYAGNATYGQSVFEPSYRKFATTQTPVLTADATPIVQGVRLISTRQLPDRFRSIFPFPLFNAVQSQSFETIYDTNQNFVLSSPTGSGKTAILELAICRLVNGFSNGTFKIVYQAPTKSLCAERQRDWQAKFGPLDLQCAELTGDTDNAQLLNVQHASVIITTPEKWDSMTRKWKDHQKLMQMVKLFLIDEVHILKEDRGATLEAVVSRMKSIGSDVRFVALSATVPNSQDIATWLGKDPIQPHLPAPRERFGEEFRPVRLRKHVCGYNSSANDFAVDKLFSSKLPEVIAKWSQRKPLMVFCFTRQACAETAKALSNWWATKSPKDRYWRASRKDIAVVDKDLRENISSGVAFHHAGLSLEDRNAVEKGYLGGDVNVICCTSTLAVGVNLPCHMVIIKNTVTYAGTACKEYSDLEVMQMLGRAGRPQFDDSAVAVIMTRLEKVGRYEKMVNGQEVLESCLHRNLIDHLNAEVALGTISNASSAKKWLAGTFLYVRLKEHPEHYRIEGDAPGRNPDERLDNICTRALGLLSQHDLVKSCDTKLQCTEFGDAMARYYIQFETMRVFLSLPRRAKISEILSAVAQAAEFKDVRFRGGEKPIYKDLNKNSSIKFPIPVNLDQPAQKVSLIMQSVLGGVDLPSQEHKHRSEYMSAKSIIFQHIHRLIRCIIDCQLHLEDAAATRNALMLARSFGAQVWDDSPLHMKQLDGVGMAYCRKIAFAGIKTIEAIENVEASAIERACTRNAPFGSQIQQKARAFPKLRVSIKMAGEPIVKKDEHVSLRVKAEIGFFNEKVPEVFQKRTVYVVMLAETSDGHLVHFARISAKKLNQGKDVLFTANLTNASQSVGCYVMCDEIAGTLRHAVLKPNIPASSFPSTKTGKAMNQPQEAPGNAPNSSKLRVSAATRNDAIDEFGDAGLADDDLAAVGGDGFVNIEEFDTIGPALRPTKRVKTGNATDSAALSDWQPRQLENGNWACSHLCKDKTSCKHKCCNNGVEKKPKPPKPKDSKQSDDPKPTHTQTQLNMSASKTSAAATHADLTSHSNQPSAEFLRKKPEPPRMKSLTRLHDSTQRQDRTAPGIGKLKVFNKPNNAVLSPGHPELSFFQPVKSIEREDESDYGDFDSTDLPDISEFVNKPQAAPSSSRKRNSVDNFEEEDGEMLDNAQNSDLHVNNRAPQHEEDEENNKHNLSDYDNLSWPGGDYDFNSPKNSPMEVQAAISSTETQHSGTNMPVAHTSSTAIPSDQNVFDIPKNQPATTDATVTEAFDRDSLVEAGIVDEEVQKAGEKGQEEARPGAGDVSHDALSEWFYQEFGTEHFQLVD
ncbi:hypothetical protein MBLNU230_g5331t1 [Neophaeotheca triangularis]